MAQEENSVERRDFLKMAAGSAAALVANANLASAQQLAAAKPEAANDEDVELLVTDNPPGSDFMVDVLKTLDLEYIASNPGSSFRSLQESFINYGGNKSPEWLTCCHEESSVAMGHGYFKIEGKPMACSPTGPSACSTRSWLN